MGWLLIDFVSSCIFRIVCLEDFLQVRRSRSQFEPPVTLLLVHWGKWRIEVVEEDVGSVEVVFHSLSKSRLSLSQRYYFHIHLLFCCYSLQYIWFFFFNKFQGCDASRYKICDCRREFSPAKSKAAKLLESLSLLPWRPNLKKSAAWTMSCISFVLINF